MKDKLSKKELLNLIKKVFPDYKDKDNLAFLIDIPRKTEDDDEKWKERRKLASDWARILFENTVELGLNRVDLIAYRAVSANNADLPQEGFLLQFENLPKTADDLNNHKKLNFKTIFDNYKIFVAMTKFSATAPLKNNAKKYGFRAATMPGFSSEMIPALKIDYERVAKKVKYVKEKLDKAVSAEVVFIVGGKEEIKAKFDLRFRKAHESSGRFPENGTAGNLPSGEAYIVPYEGEMKEKSRTEGIIPVQIENDIVYYKVVENSVIDVFGEGENVFREREHVKREPAYGNIAELGFGVLYDFGLKPIGEILLDEKLGFHIAFGRSDHFGGMVGPKDFSSPEEVIHLDRIYIKEIQPKILVKSLTLKYKNGEEFLIKDNIILTPI